MEFSEKAPEWNSSLPSSQVEQLGQPGLFEKLLSHTGLLISARVCAGGQNI